MTTIFIHHARSVLGPNGQGYCVKGMKNFAARHSLDFETFAREGIDAEVLRATGDEMALRIIEEAEKDG